MVLGELLLTVGHLLNAQEKMNNLHYPIIKDKTTHIEKIL